jgi:hypothetical protein
MMDTNNDQKNDNTDREKDKSNKDKSTDPVSVTLEAIHWVAKIVAEVLK